jgi:hypothetical protein
MPQENISALERLRTLIMTHGEEDDLGFKYHGNAGEAPEAKFILAVHKSTGSVWIHTTPRFYWRPVPLSMRVDDLDAGSLLEILEIDLTRNRSKE